MDNKFKKYWLSSLLILMCISVFTYVAVRAHTISFTHDESLTETIVRGEPRWESSANHHILNTNMMKVSNALFGHSELSLRLPNVSLFVIYLLFCFRLLRSPDNLWLLLLGASLLLFNPFVLDFFSLARGYGISLGFMMASVYYMLNASTHNYPFRPFMKDFALAMLFATLALAANLSIINYFIACLVIFIFKYIILLSNRSGLIWKNHAVFSGALIVTIVPLALALDRLFLLKNLNKLYVGTESINAMLMSLIRNSVIIVGDINLILYFICGLFLLAVLFILIKKEYEGRVFTVTLLLCLLLLGLLLEHYLFDALYPYERTGLYFIPLFALFTYYFTTQLVRQIPANRQLVSSILMCCIFSVPVLHNFATNINFQYSYAWKYDAHTKDVASILENITHESTNQRGKFVISNDWLFTPSINYYIRTRGLNFEFADRDEDHSDADFIYVFANEPIQPEYKILETFPDIRTSLYQRITGIEQ